MYLIEQESSVHNDWTAKRIKSAAFPQEAGLPQSRRALNCRAGGHRLDSRGRNSTQGLKITEKSEKWRYPAFAQQTFNIGSDDLVKWRSPSPEGVRIVFPVINFVLNALTLKESAVKNALDQGGFSQFTDSYTIMSVVIAKTNSFLVGILKLRKDGRRPIDWKWDAYDFRAWGRKVLIHSLTK